VADVVDFCLNVCLWNCSVISLRPICVVLFMLLVQSH